MLIDTLKDDIKTAMKAREAEKLETLRYIVSEINNAQIDTTDALDDDSVIKILRTEVKRRKDAQIQFQDAGRTDLADGEVNGISIIESYLPKLMDESQLSPIIKSAIEELGKDNFGAIMGKVMGQVGSQADGATVSKLIKSELAG